MKVLQKLRERPHGVEIVGLALGQPVARDETKADSDPFKVKTGGMVSMKNVTLKKVDDPYDVGIGTQFSAETNKRDEDEEMYVFPIFHCQFKSVYTRTDQTSLPNPTPLLYRSGACLHTSGPDQQEFASTLQK